MSSVSPPTARLSADAVGFLGLALFCGLAGALLVVLPTADFVTNRLSHGLLLDLFVLIPAFLGGIGRLVLPLELGDLPPLFIRFDRFSFAVLVTGTGCALVGIAVPAALVVTLLCWAVGIIPLALATVIAILECRNGRFRELTPTAWSQLLTSLGLVVLAPALLAGLAHGLMAGVPALELARHWLDRLQIPLLALVMPLALGAIAHLVVLASKRMRIVLPLLMAVPTLCVPVAWVHGLTHPALPDAIMLALGVAAPTLAVVGAICAALWHRDYAPTLALSWCFPALLMLSIGWLLALLPLHLQVFHSVMVLGAAFALFACYYRWQEPIAAIAVPDWLGQIHLVSMGMSVLLMMPLSVLAKRCGEVGLLVSIFCVAVLAARLVLLQQRQVKARRL